LPITTVFESAEAFDPVAEFEFALVFTFSPVDEEHAPIIKIPASPRTAKKLLLILYSIQGEVIT